MKSSYLITAMIFATLGLSYRAAKPSLFVSATAPSAEAGSAMHETYVCPMHSHIVQDHPGACPICGMALVSTHAAHSAEAAAIQVDSATRQNLGVQLATVEKTALSKVIHTYATLVPDDDTLFRSTPGMDGVLVKLHASRPGQRIARGEMLYEYFSDPMLQHQNEYIDYLKRLDQYRKNEERMREQNRKQLSAAGGDAAARQRAETDISQREEQLATMLVPIQRDGERLSAGLKYAGFDEAMLRTLARTRRAFSVVPVRAQQDCVVKEVHARPGMSVGMMTEILSCVGTGKAWLEIALYPDQLQSVRAGDSFTARFEDGSRLSGRISALSPVPESGSRAMRARIPVKTEEGMPLGSYAEVSLRSSPQQMLSVPTGAVLRTGHGDFVLRAGAHGHFVPVEVQTGLETEDRIAILEGLAAGDKVAVNGQFLLDAAATIADAGRRFGAPEQP